VLAVEFGLLGPLLIRDGDFVVPALAPRQRALLAALLLDAGRVVAAGELAATVWDGQPPPGARGALHTAVQRLRAALGPDGRSLIRTQSPGYLLQLGDGTLDVRQFAALAARGQASARADRWAQAAADFAAALALWRGEPLADVPSEVLRARVAPYLAEQRLEVLESRIEADLHAGDPGTLVGELRQLVTAHALRERFHAQLMLALYQAGRQADALTAYQDLRRVLADELGVDPGPEARRLHQRILRGDASLLDASRGAAGGGASGLADGHAGHGPAGPAVPRQLPSAVRHFAGRAPELRALARLLEVPGATAGTVVISAIDGTAGIGKTALAIRFAHQVADRFPDGQLYVNLRGFGPSGPPVTPAEALRGFLAALAVPAAGIPSGIEAQAALYRSLLAGRRMLIVLDNARDAEHVRMLLPGSAACLVLVTSRRQLASLVAAEGASPLTLGLLTLAEARELLTRLLGAARVAAEPTAADELIGLCARLPLALSVVAARAATRPGFPLAVLAAELRDARGRLDALDGGDAASNVRAALSWSYHQLGGPAAQMFRMLGTHPGPDISAPAAASLAGVDVEQAHRALGELAGVHLAVEHVPGRFAFHDLQRAYAAELAASSDSTAGRQEAARRALDHYVHTAHAAALLLNPARGSLGLASPQPGARPEELASKGEALAWFRAEHPVLLAAVTWAAQAGFDAVAWQLPWAMVTFLELQGHWDDWDASQRTALAAAQRLGDRPARAIAHRDLGAACTQRGHYREAHTHLRAALSLFEELGDKTDQGRVLYGLAWVLERQGRLDAARAHALRSLDMFRAAGHLSGQAKVLNVVGWCDAHLGDHDQARTRCQQALGIHRQLGDQAGEAATLDSLGFAHHQAGDYAQAISCYTRACQLRAVLGNRHSQAATLSRLGDTHSRAGDPEAACQAWREALAIFDGLHQPEAERVRAKLSGQAGPATPRRTGGR
jgi:DNA-binding SARP family transcriptional activator/Tfp pilus assembly protein PilF